MGNSAPRVRHDSETTATTGGAKLAGTDAVAARKPRPGEKAGERGVVTVKVVMTRKEAERLAARLKEQRARGRKARMAELKIVLRAGTGGDGCAMARPVWSRDALMQTQLAPIQER